MSGCQTSASSCARFCRALWSGGPYKVPGAGAAMAQQDLYRRRTSGWAQCCVGWTSSFFLGFLWPKVVWTCLNVVQRSSSRLCRYFFAEQFAEVMILGLKVEQLWFVQKQVYPCIPNKINGLRSQNCNIFFFLLLKGHHWQETPIPDTANNGFHADFPQQHQSIDSPKANPSVHVLINMCIYIYYIYLCIYIFLHGNLYAYLDLHLYI